MYVVHAISPNVNKLIPNSIKLMGGTQTVITMLTVLQVLNDKMECIKNGPDQTCDFVINIQQILFNLIYCFQYHSDKLLVHSSADIK